MTRAKRAIAITVLFCFFWNQITWANPLLSQPEFSPAVPQVFNLSIPEKLGRVQFENSGGGPTVIHIQTAHGNYEAEQKIRGLLHFLKEKYGFKLVLLEGTSQKLDPQRLDFFGEDRKLSFQAADALVHMSLMKGSEQFLMKEPGAFAYGIEDLNAYLSNGQSFSAVLTQKKKSEKFLEESDLQIERLLSAYAGPELRTFLSEYERFESQKASLLDWFRFLKIQASRLLSLDLSDPMNQFDWPMLVRMFKLEDLESRFSEPEFRRQLPLFLKEVRGVSPELADAAEKILSSPVSQAQLSYPQTGQLFEKLATEMPAIDFGAYPEVKKMITHLILQSEIRGDAAIGESEKLALMLAEKLARTPEQKKIYRLYRDYLLLKKLFALQITPLEYDQISARSAELRPLALIASFNALNGEGAVKDIRFSGPEEIQVLFDKALEFYRGAKERDLHMLEGIERRLKETGESKAVVITGGFHAGPFREHFAAKNYNYALITPSIETSDGYENYVTATLHNRSRTFFTATREVPFAFAVPDAPAEMTANAWNGSLEALVRTELKTAEKSGDIGNIVKANPNAGLFGFSYEMREQGVVVNTAAKSVLIPVTQKLNLKDAKTVTARSEARAGGTEVLPFETGARQKIKKIVIMQKGSVFSFAPLALWPFLGNFKKLFPNLESVKTDVGFLTAVNAPEVQFSPVRLDLDELDQKPEEFLGGKYKEDEVLVILIGSALPSRKFGTLHFGPMHTSYGRAEQNPAAIRTGDIWLLAFDQVWNFMKTLGLRDFPQGEPFRLDSSTESSAVKDRITEFKRKDARLDYTRNGNKPVVFINYLFSEAGNWRNLPEGAAPVKKVAPKNRMKQFWIERLQELMKDTDAYFVINAGAPGNSQYAGTANEVYKELELFMKKQGREDRLLAPYSLDIPGMTAMMEIVRESGGFNFFEHSGMLHVADMMKVRTFLIQLIPEWEMLVSDPNDPSWLRVWKPGQSVAQTLGDWLPEARSELRAGLPADIRAKGYPVAKLMTLMAILHVHGITREEYEALGGGNFDGLRDLANSKEGRSLFPSLAAVAMKPGFKNLVGAQAPQIKTIHELVKNAMDWSLVKSGKPYFRSGMHGKGALQVFSELEDRDDFVIFEVRGADGKGMRFYAWKDDGMEKIYYEFDDSIPQGLTIEVRKSKKDAKTAKQKREFLTEMIRANNGGPVMLEKEGEPGEYERINRPEDYVSIPAEINKVDADVPPVEVSITEEGYIIRDTGPGMDLKDMLEIYLLPYERRNGATQAKPSDLGKLKATVFAKPTVKRISKVEAWISGHRVDYSTNKGDERLNVADELIINFPPGTGSPESWDLIEYNRGTKKLPGAIDRMEQVIKDLTDPSLPVENRIAQINSLAILIRNSRAKKNVIAGLIAKLREGTQAYLDNRRAAGEKIILVSNKVKVPGLPFGADIFDDPKFTPLDPELFDFDFARFITESGLNLLEGGGRNFFLKTAPGLASADIYVADWRLPDGLPVVWTSLAGKPVLFINLTEMNGETPEDLLPVQGLISAYSRQIGKLSSEIASTAVAAETPKTIKKPNRLRLFFMRHWKIMTVIFFPLALLILVIALRSSPQPPQVEETREPVPQIEQKQPEKKIIQPDVERPGNFQRSDDLRAELAISDIEKDLPFFKQAMNTLIDGVERDDRTNLGNAAQGAVLRRDLLRSHIQTLAAGIPYMKDEDRRKEAQLVLAHASVELIVQQDRFYFEYLRPRNAPSPSFAEKLRSGSPKLAAFIDGDLIGKRRPLGYEVEKAAGLLDIFSGDIDEMLKNMIRINDQMLAELRKGGGANRRGTEVVYGPTGGLRREGSPDTVYERQAKLRFVIYLKIQEEKRNAKNEADRKKAERLEDALEDAAMYFEDGREAIDGMPFPYTSALVKNARELYAMQEAVFKPKEKDGRTPAVSVEELQRKRDRVQSLMYRAPVTSLLARYLEADGKMNENDKEKVRNLVQIYFTSMQDFKLKWKTDSEKLRAQETPEKYLALKNYHDSIEPLPIDLQVLLGVIDHTSIEGYLEDLERTLPYILKLVEDGKLGPNIKRPEDETMKGVVEDESLAFRARDRFTQPYVLTANDKMAQREMVLRHVIRRDLQALEEGVDRSDPRNKELLERLKELNRRFDATHSEVFNAIEKKYPHVEPWYEKFFPGLSRLIQIIVILLTVAGVFVWLRKSNSESRVGSSAPFESAGMRKAGIGSRMPGAYSGSSENAVYGRIKNARPGFNDFKPLIVQYAPKLDPNGGAVLQQVATVIKTPAAKALPLDFPETEITITGFVGREPVALPNYPDGIITDVKVRRIVGGKSVSGSFSRYGDTVTVDNPDQYEIVYKISHYRPQDIEHKFDWQPLGEEERDAWMTHFEKILEKLKEDSGGDEILAVRKFLREYFFYAADESKSLDLKPGETWADSIQAVLAESGKCSVICNQAALVNKLALDFFHRPSVWVGQIIPTSEGFFRVRTVLSRNTDGHAAIMVEKKDEATGRLYYEYEESVKYIGPKPIRLDVPRLGTVGFRFNTGEAIAQLRTLGAEAVYYGLITSKFVYSFMPFLFALFFWPQLVMFATIAIAASVVLQAVLAVLYAKSSGLSVRKTLIHNMKWPFFSLIANRIVTLRYAVKTWKILSVLQPDDETHAFWFGKFFKALRMIQRRNDIAALGLEPRTKLTFSYLRERDLIAKVRKWKDVFTTIHRRPSGENKRLGSHFVTSLFMVSDGTALSWEWDFDTDEWKNTDQQILNAWSPAAGLMSFPVKRSELRSPVVESVEALLTKAMEQDKLDEALKLLEFVNYFQITLPAGMADPQGFVTRFLQLALADIGRATELATYLKEQVLIPSESGYTIPKTPDKTYGFMNYSETDSPVAIHVFEAGVKTRTQVWDYDGVLKKWVKQRPRDMLNEIQLSNGDAVGQVTGLLYGVLEITQIEYSPEFEVYVKPNWVSGSGEAESRYRRFSILTGDDRAAINRIFPGRFRPFVEWLVTGKGLEFEKDEKLETEAGLVKTDDLAGPEFDALLATDALKKKFAVPFSLAWLVDAGREATTQVRAGKFGVKDIDYAKVRELLVNAGETRDGPASATEMLGTIPAQDRTRFIMIRELIQNARDAILENRARLQREGLKPQIRIRSFLTQENGETFWNITFEDSVGMPFEKIIRVFLPANVSDKPIEEVLKDEIGKASGTEASAAAVMALVRPEFSGNAELLAAITAIFAVEADMDTAVSRILSQYRDKFPESKKAGQFGIGKDTMYVGADKVSVRTGYRETPEERVRINRLNLAVERDDEDKDKIRDIKLDGNQGLVQYRTTEPGENEKKFIGTRVEWSQRVDPANLAEVNVQDQAMKYLIAEYVGAVSDVEIVVLDEEGKPLDIPVRDRMTTLASYGPEGRIEIVQSAMGISRLAVDTLFIQAALQDNVLNEYLTDWERQWMTQNAIGINFRPVKPAVTVTASRTALTKPAAERHERIAAARKAAVSDYRRGNLQIPVLKSYRAFLSDPRLEAGIPELMKPDVYGEAREDAAKINQGQRFAQEEETWQEYAANPEKLAAFLMHVKAPGTESGERSLLEEKRALYFAYVPEWLSNLYESDNNFRRIFEKNFTNLPDPVSARDRFSRRAAILFYQTAVAYYASGAAVIPGMPPFAEYLNADEPGAVPEAVEAMIRGVQDNNLEEVDFDALRGDNALLIPFLTSLPQPSGKTLRDMRRQISGLADAGEKKEAVSAAAETFGGTYEVKAGEFVVIDAFARFLDSLLGEMQKRLKPSDRRFFQLRTLELDLSGRDRELLNTFLSFLAVTGGETIFEDILRKVGSPEAESAIPYYVSILKKPVNQMRRDMMDGQELSIFNSTPLLEKIEDNNLLGKRTVFVYSRSEVRGLRGKTIMALAAGAVLFAGYAAWQGNKGPKTVTNDGPAPVEPAKTVSPPSLPALKVEPSVLREHSVAQTVIDDFDLTVNLEKLTEGPVPLVKPSIFPVEGGDTVRGEIKVLPNPEGWALWNVKGTVDVRAAPFMVIRYRSRSAQPSLGLYGELMGISGLPLVHERTVDNKSKIELPFKPNADKEETLTLDLRPFLVNHQNGMKTLFNLRQFAISRPKGLGNGEVTISSIQFMANLPEKAAKLVYKDAYFASEDIEDALGKLRVWRIYQQDPGTKLYRTAVLASGKSSETFYGPVYSKEGKLWAYMHDRRFRVLRGNRFIFDQEKTWRTEKNSEELGFVGDRLYAGESLITQYEGDVDEILNKARLRREMAREPRQIRASLTVPSQRGAAAGDARVLLFEGMLGAEDKKLLISALLEAFEKISVESGRNLVDRNAQRIDDERYNINATNFQVEFRYVREALAVEPKAATPEVLAGMQKARNNPLLLKEYLQLAVALNNDEAAEGIGKMLNDPDFFDHSNVRGDMIEALKLLGKQAAVAPLQQFISGKGPDALKEKAREAIETIRMAGMRSEMRTGVPQENVFGPVFAGPGLDPALLPYIAAKSLGHKSSSGADILLGLNSLSGYSSILNERDIQLGKGLSLTVKDLLNLGRLLEKQPDAIPPAQILADLIKIKKELDAFAEQLEAARPSINELIETFAVSDPTRAKKFRRYVDILDEQSTLLLDFVNDRIALAEGANTADTASLAAIKDLLVSRHGNHLVLDENEWSGETFARISKIRLFSILNNLVSNSRDAQGIRDWSVRLKIETRNDRVVLTVSDEGPGLPEEFFETTGASARMFGIEPGKGLGLAEVWATSALAGATVTVRSTAGKATEFIIEIPTAARSELRSTEPKAAPIVNRTFSGVSAKILGVSPLSRIMTWEPQKERPNPQVSRLNDSPVTKSIKIRNELSALDSTWARVVAKLADPSDEELFAIGIVTGGMMRVKNEIIETGLKAQEAIRHLVDRGMFPSLNPMARDILFKELIPALEDRDEFLFINEDEEIKGMPAEKAREVIITRYQELVLIKLYQVILNLPYGFRTENSDVANLQRNLAQSRKLELEAEIPDILEAIRNGSSPRAAVQGSIDKFYRSVKELDIAISAAKDAEARKNLKTLRTIAMEQISYMEKIGSDFDTYDYLYEPKDPRKVRRARIREELGRHKNFIARTYREFPQLKPELSLKVFFFRLVFLAAWLVNARAQVLSLFKDDPRLLGDRFDYFVRMEIRKGRPIQYASSKFFAQNRDVIDANAWSFMMRHYDLSEFGETQRESENPVIVFAKEIRNESDYNRLMASFAGRGKIVAIVAPKEEGELRIPHWFIYAKKEGILVITSLDMRGSGITFEDMKKEEGLEHRGIVDGQRGVIVVNPDDETLENFRRLGDTYHDMSLYFAARARKQTVFNLWEFNIGADETEIDAIEEFPDRPSLLFRSGARSLDLFRLEELLTAQPGRAGIELDRDRIHAALSEIQSFPFFRGGGNFTVRLFDVAPDKRPQFLIEGSKGLRGWDMDEVMRNMTGARFYLSRDPKYKAFRDFGKMQLKAIFAAHLQKGLRRSGIRILFSDVRNANEIRELEVLLDEAKKEFMEEVKDSMEAAAVLEYEHEDFTKSLATTDPSEMDERLDQIPVGYMFEDTLSVENERESMMETIAELRKGPRRQRFIGIGSNDLSKSISKERRGGTMALDELSPLLVRDIALIAQSAEKRQIAVNLEGEWGGSIYMLFVLFAIRMTNESLRIHPVSATAQIPELLEMVRELKPSDLRSTSGTDRSLVEMVRAIMNSQQDAKSIPMAEWAGVLERIKLSVRNRVLGGEEYNYFMQQLDEGTRVEEVKLELPREVGDVETEVLSEAQAGQPRQIRQTRLYRIGGYAYHTHPNRSLMEARADTPGVTVVYKPDRERDKPKLYQLTLLTDLIEARMIKGDKINIIATGPENAVEEFFRKVEAIKEEDNITTCFLPAARSELRAASVTVDQAGIDRIQSVWLAALGDPSRRQAAMKTVWQTSLNSENLEARAAAYYLLTDMFKNPGNYPGLNGPSEIEISRRVLYHAFYDPSLEIRKAAAYNTGELIAAFSDRQLLQALRLSVNYRPERLNDENKFQAFPGEGDPRLEPGIKYSREIQIYNGMESVLFALYRRLQDGSDTFVKTEAQAAEKDFIAARQARNPELLERSDSELARALHAVLFEYFREEFVERNQRDFSNLKAGLPGEVRTAWRMSLARTILGARHQETLRVLSEVYFDFVKQNVAALGPETKGVPMSRVLGRSELRAEEAVQTLDINTASTTDLEPVLRQAGVAAGQVKLMARELFQRAKAAPFVDAADLGKFLNENRSLRNSAAKFSDIVKLFTFGVRVRTRPVFISYLAHVPYADAFEPSREIFDPAIAEAPLKNGKPNVIAVLEHADAGIAINALNSSRQIPYPQMAAYQWWVTIGNGLRTHVDVVREFLRAYRENPQFRLEADNAFNDYIRRMNLSAVFNPQQLRERLTPGAPASQKASLDYLISKNVPEVIFEDQNFESGLLGWLSKNLETGLNEALAAGNGRLAWSRFTERTQYLIEDGLIRDARLNQLFARLEASDPARRIIHDRGLNHFNNHQLITGTGAKEQAIIVGEKSRMRPAVRSVAEIEADLSLKKKFIFYLIVQHLESLGSMRFTSTREDLSFYKQVYKGAERVLAEIDDGPALDRWFDELASRIGEIAQGNPGELRDASLTALVERGILERQTATLYGFIRSEARIAIKKPLEKVTVEEFLTPAVRKLLDLRGNIMPFEWEGTYGREFLSGALAGILGISAGPVSPWIVMNEDKVRQMRGLLGLSSSKTKLPSGYFIEPTIAFDKDLLAVARDIAGEFTPVVIFVKTDEQRKIVEALNLELKKQKRSVILTAATVAEAERAANKFLQELGGVRAEKPVFRALVDPSQSGSALAESLRRQIGDDNILVVTQRMLKNMMEKVPGLEARFAALLEIRQAVASAA